MQPYKPSDHEIDQIVSSYITQVCIWMTAGFTLSGIAAHITTRSESVCGFIFNNLLFLIMLVLLELIVVFLIMAYLEVMPSLVAACAFLFYSAATGIGLAIIFIVIPIVTISNVFFVLSITFMIMSIYGAVTKCDLTEQQNIFKMLPVGILVSAFINLLIQHSVTNFVVSCAVVVLFAGIMTNKRWKLHEFAKRDDTPDELRDGPKDTSETSHFAIIGALTLYLFR